MSEQEDVGLCFTCQHVRRVESARGSTFYLCRLGSVDERFSKYPRLPIRQCTGYKAVEQTPP